MKILIIHVHYQMRGGEDSVFEQEVNLLSQVCEVETLTFQNKPGWRGGIQFFLSIWNVWAAMKLKKVIRDFKPDIIHIHNLHFGIGPIAICTAKSFKIPVVFTLHNYRLLCPSGILYHTGQLFTDSLNSSFPWKAIRNKVYRASYVQTFWLSFIVWFHKKIKTWSQVDRYIVLTDFAKELFLNSSLGVNKYQLVVKPNFVEEPFKEPVSRNDHLLFVGRLTEEKGIGLLLNTFLNNGFKLKIAGSGPLVKEVVNACKADENIAYIGNLDREGVLSAMQNCSALVFTSTWYEGMPITILEAFATGTPVIASNIGAMSSMIKHGYNGLHFEAGNSLALTQQLNEWVNVITEEEKISFGEQAYKTYIKHYTASQNKGMLLKIYQDVVKPSPI